jgi:hypothetical protein
MHFWRKRDLSENILVIHIDSGSVGAALMHKAPDATSEIIYKTRISFLSTDAPTVESLEKPMLGALSEALTQLSKNGLMVLKDRGFVTKIHRASVALSSPWIVSSLKIANVHSDEPFSLDSHVIKDAMLREEEKMRGESKTLGGDEMFESAFVGLRVNGYKTHFPVSQKVTDAEIDFVLNAARKDLIKRVGDELHKHFSPEKGIALQGFMFAYFTVLSHVFQNLHSSLLINITNEATEILFVEHGNPRLLTSIPFGPVTIARKIKDRLNMPLPVSESYIQLFASEVLNLQSTIKFEPIIAMQKDEWKALWTVKAERHPSIAKSPFAVFLTTHPKYKKIAKLFLEGVLPDKNIVVLGEDSTFTQKITKSPEGGDVDENLAIACFYDTIQAS